MSSNVETNKEEINTGEDKKDETVKEEGKTEEGKAEEGKAEEGEDAEEQKPIPENQESDLGIPKKQPKKDIPIIEDYKYDGIQYEEITEFDSSALSPIEIDVGDRVFKSLDKDTNGYIEPADMKAGLESND